MNKFKVGDRIKVYYGGTVYRGEVYDVGTTSVHYRTNRNMSGDIMPNCTYTAHYKQCRKLVPKKPRRRIWVPRAHPIIGFSRIIEDTGHLNDYLNTKPAIDNKITFTEFVEVRRKGDK